MEEDSILKGSLHLRERIGQVMTVCGPLPGLLEYDKTIRQPTAGLGRNPPGMCREHPELAHVRLLAYRIHELNWLLTEGSTSHCNGSATGNSPLPGQELAVC